MAIPALEIEITADSKGAEVAFGRVSKALGGVEQATDDYKRELTELQRAEARGLVTKKQAAAALKQIEDRYEAAARDAAAYAGASIRATQSSTGLTGSLGRLGNASGAARAQVQNASFQIADFATQVGAGTSASVALGQQLPQLLGGFGLLGAAAGAFVAVGVPLAASLIDLGDNAEDAADVLDELAGIQSALESNTKRLRLSISDLADEYGEAAKMVRAFSISQAEALVAQAENRLKDQLLILGDVVDQYGEATRVIDEFGSTSFDITDSLRALERDLGVTRETAKTLFQAFKDLNDAQGYEQQRDALAEVDRLLAAANVSAGELPPELNNALIELRDMVFATEQLRDLMVEAGDAAASIQFPQAPPAQPGFSFGGRDFGRTPPGGGGAFVDPSVGFGDYEDAPPSRRAGGGRAREDRIGALAQSLMTESELVETWRAESLEKLADFNALELEALGGHNEAKLRLEEEYQRRKAEIQEATNANSVEGILSGGAQILQAMGQNNKKALKVSQAFAAAEALISTYKGAAKELEKGTFGFATAAAVISKGIAFVSAIRSVNASTGASGGGASAGSTATAAAPAPLEVRLSGISADTIISGADLGGLLDRLNEEAGDRGTRLTIAT